MVKLDEQYTLDEIVAELKDIKYILEINSRKALQQEIEKLANTKERKLLWTLADGTKGYEELAKAAGITPRATQYFIQDGISIGLLTREKRGYPKRKFSYVPVEWPQFTKNEKNQKNDEKPMETVGDKNDGRTDGIA